jgi:hypothetical protein
MKRILLALAALCLAAPPAAAQARMGSFVYFDQKDPITDANSSYIYAEEASGGFMPAMLMYKCEGNEVLAAIKGAGFYMEESLPVTWRFDQQPPRTAPWRIADVQWVILPMEFQQEFRTVSESATRLAVRVHESDGQFKTYVFNMDGFGRAVAAMGCGV